MLSLHNAYYSVFTILSTRMNWNRCRFANSYDINFILKDYNIATQDWWLVPVQEMAYLL